MKIFNAKKSEFFTDSNHNAHNKWNLLGGLYFRATTREYNAEKQKSWPVGIPNILRSSQKKTKLNHIHTGKKMQTTDPIWTVSTYIIIFFVSFNSKVHRIHYVRTFNSLIVKSDTEWFQTRQNIAQYIHIISCHSAKV